MSDPGPSPLQRLALAFYALFAILFRPEVARAAWQLRAQRQAGALPGGQAAEEASTAAGRVTREAERVEAPPAPPAGPSPERVARRAALQLLGALQREGRLVDFLEEDLTGFPDAAVGAAARAVHEGCKRALAELVRLEPVFREAEGAAVEVRAGFDPAAVRLTGSVVGSPPFKGALRHHGWRAEEVRLPAVADGLDPAILAPAEVEL